MKWLIASDLHGSAYYCRQLLAAYDREGADRMLLLGDLLYHGPRNDLPREYDPKADSPHGYMTLEDGLFLWKTLNGETYREFRL